MDIRIIPVTDNELYEVNGKEIYKDGDVWTARVELTQNEKNAFNRYRKTVIENPNFKKHTRATYQA
jgi:hypothetical protein